MVILIGESGSGKSTILEELCKRSFEKAKNYTTRQKRVGEENGQDMFFITNKIFLF